jgi:ribosomal protein L11
LIPAIFIREIKRKERKAMAKLKKQELKIADITDTFKEISGLSCREII